MNIFTRKKHLKAEKGSPFLSMKTDYLVMKSFTLFAHTISVQICRREYKEKILVPIDDKCFSWTHQTWVGIKSALSLKDDTKEPADYYEETVCYTVDIIFKELS